MQLFANNAASVLANGISSAATTAQLAPGTGARFPNPANGNYFLLTLYQMSGSMEVNHEIVKCSAKNGDTITILRAQEGTTARAFNTADPVSLRLTAGSLTPAAIGAYEASNPAGFISSVPIASTNIAGIIKVGANLAIDAGGVLSAPPPATNGALILLANVVISNPVAQIDFLSLFSAAYDSYLLEGLGVKCSNTDALILRLANAGTVDSGQNFASMANGTTSSTSSFIYATGTLTQGGKGAHFSIEFKNTNDANTIKAIYQRAVSQSSSTPQYEGRDYQHAYLGGAISGFRLVLNNGSYITNGTLRIYGLKNS